MADAGLVVNIDVSELKKHMDNLGQQFQQEPLLKGIGLRQVKWINDNFEQRGALAGGWKPLSPFTIAHRIKGSDVPLQDKGLLRASFTPGARDSRFGVAGNTVTVGTAIPYASFHEEGVLHPIYPVKAKALGVKGPRGWALHHTSGIPKRKMLPTPQQARDISVAFIQAKIKKITSGGT